MTAETVGVVPAAGTGSRVAPLPCSKEIYPVGVGRLGQDPTPRPRAAFQYLLERIRLGGARSVYVVLRRHKWDIPDYLGDGAAAGVNLAYLVTERSGGVPHTVDQAYPFVRRARVLFGLADILFWPEDAYVPLVEKLSNGPADVVLGVFPAHSPWKSDMVELGDGGRVRSIVIKPATTDLRHTWLIAAWTPRFTDYLHAFVEQDLAGGDADETAEVRESYLGDVLQAGIEEGLRVDSVTFEDGAYRDIGTLEDLLLASRALSAGEVPIPAEPVV